MPNTTDFRQQLISELRLSAAEVNGMGIRKGKAAWGSAGYKVRITVEPDFSVIEMVQFVKDAERKACDDVLSTMECSI